MAISDLYSSGEHKRNIGHFSDIVKLALLDGEIEKREGDWFCLPATFALPQSSTKMLNPFKSK